MWPRRASWGLVGLLLSCGPSDYQEPGAPPPKATDLRARVEQLRHDARREPTTKENVYRRADVVWEWANAMALAGEVIPADVPLTIALIRFAEADGGVIDLTPGIELPLELHIPRLDQYIAELGLKEDDPTALGKLHFPSQEALLARSWGTVEEIYTVGTTAVAVGGGFLIGKAGTTDVTRPQNEDPAANNYVTVRSSNPAVRFEPHQVPWNGVHSNVPAKRPLPAFRVAEAGLEPGDTVTVTFGDRSGGSPGLVIPTHSNDSFLLPVYVDLEGDGNYMTPRFPAREIVGQPEPTAVRLLAPSIVRPGESFKLTVRSEDEAMNRSSGESPAYEVSLQGETVARIPAGFGALATLPEISLSEPGVHRFLVRSADAGLEGWSNPIWVEEDPKHRIYWGDTHGHTGLAEGQGSARAFFRYAKDDARLDFVTLSEHDIWMDDSEWFTMQDLTREFSADGDLVGIIGYEWTAFNNRGGHHNVFFRKPLSARVGVQDATRLADLYRELHRLYDPGDVLVIPHAHRSGDWTRSDPELERLVELYSVHGSFEWFANKYLMNGFELGFVAAADDHLAKPGLSPPPTSSVSQPGGLAAVLAGEKTTDAIFDSLRGLATYATSGQRIILDASLNGFAMGTRQADTKNREIRCRVMGTSPIESIDVIKNGEVVLGRRYLTKPLTRHAWLQVAFASSSEVIGPERDNPRGYRLWKGTLEVSGARVVSLDPAGIDNPVRESVELEEGGNRIRFEILTRGRADSMLLELEGASVDTSLHFTVEPTREIGPAPILRPAANIDAVDIHLRLSDLQSGRLEHELLVGEHVDSIALQVIDPEGALDRDFEYTDLGERASGDYYYVRVTQLDGGRAWSSPFWVGERDPYGETRRRSSTSK